MAADDVRRRMDRATAALEAAGIAFLVIGGNAVAEWVGRVDADAVRSTRDVDLLIARDSLDDAKAALGNAGFVYSHTAGVTMFLEADNPSPRASIHVIFANEKVREEYVAPAPGVNEVEQAAPPARKVVTLEALIRMKLTAYRLKDRMHIVDMIGVGLVDSTWIPRLPAPLAERLQALIDNPDG